MFGKDLFERAAIAAPTTRSSFEAHGRLSAQTLEPINHPGIYVHRLLRNLYPALLSDSAENNFHHVDNFILWVSFAKDDRFA